jgi:hypothetical protein
MRVREVFGIAAEYARQGQGQGHNGPKVQSPGDGGGANITLMTSRLPAGHFSGTTAASAEIADRSSPGPRGCPHAARQQRLVGGERVRDRGEGHVLRAEDVVQGREVRVSPLFGGGQRAGRFQCGRGREE